MEIDGGGGGKLPLRFVGAASIVFGVCIVALGLNPMGVSKEIAASLTGGGHAWSLPVSREVFLTRSKIWTGIVISVGVLTVVGGLGMAFRKRRGFYIAAVAALVMLLFPSMSRLFPAKAYAFEDLSLVDFGVVAVVGLSASLAWMFWPK
jgi:hypothetical protein